MHRLLACLVAVAALPACLDTGSPYEVTVDWTTSNPPSESVVTQITYDGETIETHGSLESHGHSGTALVSGETYQPTIEICVELGNYAYVDHQTGYGCESGDYECDPPVYEFVPTKSSCVEVAPTETHVHLLF
jgi:hypothetical protein